MRLQVVTVVAGKVTVLLHMMWCKFTHVHAVPQLHRREEKSFYPEHLK
jgi:hypothetical protein